MSLQTVADKKLFPDIDLDAIERLPERGSGKVDLADLLRGPISELYVKTSSALEQSFVKSKVVQLPTELQEQIDQTDRCSMGLIPAIHRAWLSVGGQLFIWSYTGEQDLYSYNSPGQTIYTVGFAKTTSAVFGPETSQMLVIATSSLVVLHGVMMDTSSGEFQLTKHSLASSCGGVTMSNIMGADNGRIFMTGHDNHVYEVEYNKTNCRLLCRTENPYAKYLPWFLQSAPEVGIQTIAIDNDRKLIYLLTVESTIKAISIGNRGEYTMIASSGSIEKAAQAIYNKLQSTAQTDDFKLASLHVIPKATSKTICLSALTSHGFRLYFALRDDKTLGKIELVHVRLPAPIDFNPSELFHEDFYNHHYHSNFQENGVFSCARTSAPGVDKLLISSTDTGDILLSDDTFIETCSAVDVDGKVWAVAKVCQDAYTDHLNSYVVLSDNALTFFNRRQPSEVLAGLLLEDNTQRLQAFIDRYGMTKSCLLCLYILCTSSSVSEKEAARKLFLKCDASNRENSFLQYFTRTVKPVWKVKVSQSSQKDLQNTEADLEALHKTIDGITQNQRTLLVHCIEAIHFVNILTERSVQIESKDSPTLEEMVTTENGHIAARKLAETAIKDSHGEMAQGNVATLSEVLKDGCSLYFTTVDISLYKGLENLEYARRDKSGTKKKELIEISIDAFRHIASNLTNEHVEELCVEFCKLDHHSGAATLATERALEQSLRIQLSGIQRSDSEAVSERAGIFRIVYQVLEDAYERSDAFNEVLLGVLALAGDKYSHYAIYDWMIEKEMSDSLTKVESPHIEQYLSSYRQDTIGKNILWKYWKHNKNYQAATLCLKELATSTSSFDLSKRIEYLLMAIDSAQNGAVDHGLRAELDQLNKTATIQSHLQQTLTTRGERSAAKQLDEELKDIDALFDQAHDSRSWEEVLLLLEAMKRQDFVFLRHIWASLVDSIGNNDTLLISKVTRLGKKLYPSMVVFPVYMIIFILDGHCAKYHKDSPKAIVEKIMHTIGVPDEVVSDAYQAISSYK